MSSLKNKYTSKYTPDLSDQNMYSASQILNDINSLLEQTKPDSKMNEMDEYSYDMNKMYSDYSNVSEMMNYKGEIEKQKGGKKTKPTKKYYAYEEEDVITSSDEEEEEVEVDESDDDVDVSTTDDDEEDDREDEEEEEEIYVKRGGKYVKKRKSSAKRSASKKKRASTPKKKKRASTPKKNKKRASTPKRKSSKNTMSRENVVLQKRALFMKFMQKETGLKGGPALISLMSEYIKNAQKTKTDFDEALELAKKLVMDDIKKGVIEKKYNEIAEAQRKKREDKKKNK